MTKSSSTTHETFIHAVRDLVLADASLSDEERQRLEHAKLVYGVGDGRYRGVCYYQAWENGVGTVDVVEIAATGEESWVQLAGTVIHELGHVLGGMGTGHGAEWKAATVRLGFTVRPEAAGQVYRLAMIRPTLRHAIARLAAEISDGSPAFRMAAIPVVTIPRPCTAGHGVKGGRSRQAGSSNRQVKATCGCGRIIRASRSTFEAAAIRCERCGETFEAEPAVQSDETIEAAA